MTRPRRFLLKYATRDEVQILSQGDGGIAEMRNSIASYDETSPLYGFLKYRRRNVIIKYMPEGCSRLIQGLSRSLVLHLVLAMSLCFRRCPQLPSFDTLASLTCRTPPSFLQFESLSITMQSANSSVPTTTHWKLPRPKSSTTISYRRPVPKTPQPSPSYPLQAHCVEED